MLLTLDHRLCFASEKMPECQPIYVDFVEGKAGHRRRVWGREAIARAVGVKKNAPLRVIDATAGLGRDAFVLASLGCEMTLIERSPIMAALLEDGLRRARENSETQPIAVRMNLIQGAAHVLLPTLSADVVYLDPMYPHREKSALVKKDMRILRELLGDDLDADALLPLALQAAKKRVVVKRPAHANPLAGQKPSLTFPGNSSRFDVYMI